MAWVIARAGVTSEVGGVQRHAGLPPGEELGHDRLVGREQAAARPRVIADGS